MDFPLHIPFVVAQGFELVSYGDGQAELQLQPGPTQLNSWQIVHGGVLMTLLDAAMAHAAFSLDKARATRPSLVTLEMKTTFLRPALGLLRAEGKLLHRSSRLGFTEGRVLNAAGEMCAHATGTFKYMNALPSSVASELASQGTADHD